VPAVPVLPPYPVAPAPRTWSALDPVYTFRLNNDLQNAVMLLASRPLLAGQQQGLSQALGNAVVSPVSLDTINVDNWQGFQVVGTAVYKAPLAGWYLCEGDVAATIASVPNTATLLAGIQATQNSVVTSDDGGKIFGNGVSIPDVTCADLVQLDPSTADTVALYAQLNSGATGSLASPGAKFKIEWAGLPSTLSAGNGTVVASPQAAALWPPGSGTTITNGGGIAAGATSMTAGANTGMVVGGVLGLNVLNGVPGVTAENVTITSVAGTTIGISATVYSHAQTEPVAVPVSAAWLNQQCRDIINFLSYPPLARLDTSGTAATMATQAFPAGQAITFLRATADNFTGWNAAAKSQYAFPVAGVYYVYGQVYLSAAAASYTLSAGLGISGGTIQWGTTTRNASATGRTMCATVRRHLRVTAGQYVQLFGAQNSATTFSLAGSAPAYCTLICLWRGF
jgi:hypothetical protein